MSENLYVSAKAMGGPDEVMYLPEEVSEINDVIMNVLRNSPPDAHAAFVNNINEPVEVLVYWSADDDSSLVVGDGFIAKMILKSEDPEVKSIGPYTDPNIRDMYFKRLRELPPFMRRFMSTETRMSFTYKQ